MIRRIKVRGYKSLADVEVNLQPLCVLFGPNAAGKSNFLDCLQLLSRLVTSRSLKEAFEPPYRGKPLESFSFGEAGLAGLLHKDHSSFCIEVDVELSPGVIRSVSRQIIEMRRANSSNGAAGAAAENPLPVREKFLRYRLEVDVLPRSGMLRVADEYLSALNQHGQPTGKRMPFLDQVDERLRLRMEGQAHPIYYERYLDHTILSRPLYPPHYPHLVAMREELERWLFFYFEPRERMRAASPVKEVRHIGMMGEELAAFLNTLKALDEKQFDAVKKALRLLVPTATDIDVSVNPLGEVELTLWEGSTPIPSRLLSEGTLRILGLLSLEGAQEPPSLVGFEEPENGIHPRRIGLIAEYLKTQALLGRTQLIVTTHSPTLIDSIPAKFLYAVHQQDQRTTIEGLEDRDGLWLHSAVDQALNEDGEAPTVSELVLRGDFDA